MRRALIGIILLLNVAELIGQTQVLELGTRTLDISTLSTRGQEQFEADVAEIKEDPRLREVYSAKVKKYARDFQGTDDERTKMLAKFAREIVSNNHTVTTQPTGMATLEKVAPELAADLPHGKKVINRSVSVSSDALMKRRTDMEIIENPEESTSPDEGSQVDPLTPTSSTNTFKGEIAYVLPDTMEVGTTESVRLVVAVDPDVAKQLAEQAGGGLTSSEIGIGRSMKAELTDYNAFEGEEGSFDINLWEGSEVQLINVEDDNAFVVWEWKVRPKVAGNHILGIKVSIILYDDALPDGKGYQSIDTYEQPVLIVTTATTASLGDQGDSNAASTDSMLPQIGGAILLLFLLGFVTYRFTRSRATKAIAKAKEKSLPQVIAGDGKADPAEIKVLIKAGKFEEAAGELKDLALLRNYPNRTEIIALQARIEHWQRDVHNNVITTEAANQERSRITLALLHTLEEILEEEAH